MGSTGFTWLRPNPTPLVKARATPIGRLSVPCGAIKQVPNETFILRKVTSLHIALLATLLAMPLLRANAQDTSPLLKLLQSVDVAPGDARPEPARLASSSTSARQFPLYKAVMAQPLQAPYRIGMMAQGYRQAVSSAHGMVAMTGSVAGLAVARPKEIVLGELEKTLRMSQDPLAVGLAWMTAQGRGGKPWPHTLPSTKKLPEPLRFELAMVLASIGRANQFLQRALARIPATATPKLLRRQALDDVFLPFEEPDYRNLLAMVEREALLAGMLDLTAAVERLQHFVSTAQQLPSVAWTLNTPMGQIVVDTTGHNNTYKLKDPLLVVDVGGDDVYEFLPRSDKHRISVLLDHLGDDRYVATTPGSDPSAATLGYGILWDTEGNDYYQGTQHAQASALFGAALLVDGGGDNTFIASSHGQAHAIAGFAVLLGAVGGDHYTAQASAQGSAGPEGVAALIDPGGDDSYILDNTPLIRPSAQLPLRNSSMGQGAGRGIRGDFIDGRSTTGGIGILLDMAGNDHYVAQVFAQGVGYYEGLGILVDDDGKDTFDATWYAMGAAAHRGAGILLKRGVGNDHYHASHSMSIGAAHDFSVGIFLDEGGDDQYELGDLGLGAAYDNSTALFVDAKGDDRYAVKDLSCRAFGVAQLSQWGGVREDLPNLGLFMDLGGGDAYPDHCQQAGNNTEWTSRQTWPQLKLRSEAGAGIDGEFLLPFFVRPRTR